MWHKREVKGTRSCHAQGYARGFRFYCRLESWSESFVLGLECLSYGYVKLRLRRARRQEANQQKDLYTLSFAAGSVTGTLATILESHRKHRAAVSAQAKQNGALHRISSNGTSGCRQESQENGFNNVRPRRIQWSSKRCEFSKSCSVARWFCWTRIWI